MTDAAQREVEKFLLDLLNPEGFGHSVTAEVRNEVRRLLDLLGVYRG